MKRIQEIERHFGIRIKLKELKTPEETEETYRAVDIVHSGIQMKPNVISEMDCNQFDDDIDVLDPLLIASGEKTQLPCITIHDWVFTPQRIYLLPMHISRGEQTTIFLQYSVQFELSHEI